MFGGFAARDLDVGGGIRIHARIGGSGPPVLLLHGYPQMHVCWHKVAPRLAERFTVIVADLRGYGASSKPTSAPDHATYSKRAMAADQVEVMRQLGFERFAVVGHDRGGRVAHRMALDHPGAVAKLSVVDIAPTATMYQATNMAFAQSYYHWFFLIQPFDFPERLIGADPEYFLRQTLKSWCKTQDAITEQAFAAYLAAFNSADAIHATCEDYRAAASIDLEHDAADEAAGNRITAPVNVTWGARGTIGKQFDALATWKAKSASKVEGCALDCGHFVPEEDPEGLVQVLERFLE
ncbi:MAG: alpha/beta hydrolase [Alphaproteobacteria bacterium]|nr:alpha/beta hydrolase [Alphaproteobacteria bacterium]